MHPSIFLSLALTLLTALTTTVSANPISVPYLKSRQHSTSSSRIGPFYLVAVPTAPDAVSPLTDPSKVVPLSFFEPDAPGWAGARLAAPTKSSTPYNAQAPTVTYTSGSLGGQLFPGRSDYWNTGYIGEGGLLQFDDGGEAKGGLELRNVAGNIGPNQEGELWNDGDPLGWAVCDDGVKGDQQGQKAVFYKKTGESCQSITLWAVFPKSPSSD